MKKTRKLVSLLCAAAMVFATAAAASAAPDENADAATSAPAEGTLIAEKYDVVSSETATVLHASGDKKYVMAGVHGTTLLVDSISGVEYSEMMSILYPNSIVDAQGQEIGGIANMEEARADFIAAHMKAYSVAGGKQAEVSLKPFTVTIESGANGSFEALLYTAQVGQDTFLFPSEWGNQPFGFAHVSEKNVYLAFTDIGIWQLDPDTLTADKITSDCDVSRVQAELPAEPSDSYLVWVDSVVLSPDGKTVVFRTNRDAADPNNTSVWSIDLASGVEKQLVAPAENNDIVGFIDDGAVVLGALADTRIADVTSRSITALNIPELPHRDIKGVDSGKLVISSYCDGSSDSTVYVNRVNTATGAMVELTSATGYFSGEASFSPSGSKIALGYGTDAEMGTDDVLIMDTQAKTDTLLSSSAASAAQGVRSAQSSAGVVDGYLWLDDDTILVDTQEENAIAPVPTEDGPMLAAAYDIVFGNTPPSIVNFNSPLSDTSTEGFTNVNSKWNQPRKTGTNPHNGVDLAAAEGREVYAPYAGWLEHLANGIGSGNHNIQLLVDANNNQVKDDGDYYVRFYHMSGREPAGYKSQDDLIGRSGKEGTTFAHLHFGICSLNGGLKWLRNEVNYRHLSEDNWSAGKDLDIYSHVEWNNNTASLVAYAHDDEDKTQPLSEVRIYYRSTPTGTWINGGTMTKAAGANNYTYTYDFTGIFPSGSTVYWMVRLTRKNVSQVAYCPAKFFQPSSDPNSVSPAYGYWTNTIG